MRFREIEVDFCTNVAYIYRVYIICQKFHYSWANIVRILCGPGGKYVDLRATPPIDACVVLSLSFAPSSSASLFWFLPLRPLPPPIPLSLPIAAHLSSSSLSFSCIRALVTLLHCENICLPSGRGWKRGMLIFHRSPFFFHVSAALSLFLSRTISLVKSHKRDPLRKSKTRVRFTEKFGP